jgi:hypothetical protein
MMKDEVEQSEEPSEVNRVVESERAGTLADAVGLSSVLQQMGQTYRLALLSPFAVKSSSSTCISMLAHSWKRD